MKIENVKVGDIIKVTHPLFTGGHYIYSVDFIGKIEITLSVLKISMPNEKIKTFNKGEKLTIIDKIWFYPDTKRNIEIILTQLELF